MKREISEKLRKATVAIRADKMGSPNKWTKELRTQINKKISLAQWLINNGEAPLGGRMVEQALADARVK